MPLRGSPALRATDSPLTGVLRDLDRRTRAVERERPRNPPEERYGPRGERGEPGPPGERGERGEAGPPGRGTWASLTTATDRDGRAITVWSPPLPGPPVITALATDPGPDDTSSTVITVLEEATASRAVVRVWQLGPAGPAPAGPGITVHLTANGPHDRPPSG